jgi:hypothetical protein
MNRKANVTMWRKPKRVRNLLIAAVLSVVLLGIGLVSWQVEWYYAAAAVFALAVVSPWFARKLGNGLYMAVKTLVYTLLRLVTALFFYSVISPIAFLLRLQKGPWRAKNKASYAAPPRRPPTAADFERLR